LKKKGGKTAFFMQLGPQNGLNPISKVSDLSCPCILFLFYFVFVSVDGWPTSHNNGPVVIATSLPFIATGFSFEVFQICLRRSRSLSRLREPTARARPWLRFPLLEMRSKWFAVAWPITK